MKALVVSETQRAPRGLTFSDHRTLDSATKQGIDKRDERGDRRIGNDSSDE